MTPTEHEERESKKLMDGLARLLVGKPIDLIAPIMVVAVARMLYIEADNDPEKLGYLVFKFINRLTETVMSIGQDEGLGEPRQ